MIAALFFWMALFLELLYIVLFLWTIRNRSFRFWPPPSARSWQFFLSWTVAALVAVFFFFVGLFDFDSFVLPAFRVRSVFAVPLFVMGGGIGAWASAKFPLRTILGLRGRLVTTGPYRFSRNPQYMGDSLLIAGYFVLTNSGMVGVIGLLGVLLNLLAVFTEEPWLEEKYGDAYLEYKRRVPRYLGRRKNSA
jgi:protein-S-isoprenylcysteine O-methyltransferase Ste14